MLALIRRKLAAAAEVLAFATKYPDTDPSHVAVVTRLQAAVERADVLAQQQHDGSTEELGAQHQRRDVRRQVEAQIRHLAHVGREALADHPELQGAFTLPRHHAAAKTFITAVRSMLTTATAQKDLLIDRGLGTDFVDDLAKAVADFDASTLEASASRLDHVGATAELPQKTEECMRLIGVLDGLNRKRFADNPDLLAEWISAQHVDRRNGPRRRGVNPVPEPVAPPVPEGKREVG
jgi:hypothetical protein